MKRIKLFESFNKKNTFGSFIDIRDDIKSILYELEDAGLNPKLEANIEFKDFDEAIDSDLLEDYVTKTGSCYDKDNYVSYFLIETDFDSSDLESYKEKMERFLVLLKEHLDYIDPRKIEIVYQATFVIWM